MQWPFLLIKLLINYTNADDAFITKDFSYGHIKGANGFNKYCKHFQGGYFVLENDEINNYGILVASCNNAAVENISKELPKAKDIINSLDGDILDKDFATNYKKFSLCKSSWNKIVKYLQVYFS